MLHKIFVGIGSNIDREKNIKSCVSILKDVYGDMRISPVYETESMGFDGPNFCLLYTSPSPRDGLLSRMPSSA